MPKQESTKENKRADLQNGSGLKRSELFTIGEVSKMQKHRTADKWNILKETILNFAVFHAKLP